MRSQSGAAQQSEDNNKSTKTSTNSTIQAPLPTRIAAAQLQHHHHHHHHQLLLPNNNNNNNSGNHKQHDNHIIRSNHHASSSDLASDSGSEQAGGGGGKKKSKSLLDKLASNTSALLYNNQYTKHSVFTKMTAAATNPTTIITPLSSSSTPADQQQAHLQSTKQQAAADANKQQQQQQKKKADEEPDRNPLFGFHSAKLIAYRCHRFYGALPEKTMRYVGGFVFALALIFIICMLLQPWSNNGNLATNNHIIVVDRPSASSLKSAHARGATNGNYDNNSGDRQQLRKINDEETNLTPIDSIEKQALNGADFTAAASDQLAAGEMSSKPELATTRAPPILGSTTSTTEEPVVTMALGARQRGQLMTSSSFSPMSSSSSSEMVTSNQAESADGSDSSDRDFDSGGQPDSDRDAEIDVTADGGGNPTSGDDDARLKNSLESTTSAILDDLLKSATSSMVNNNNDANNRLRSSAQQDQQQQQQQDPMDTSSGGGLPFGPFSLPFGLPFPAVTMSNLMGTPKMSGATIIISSSSDPILSTSSSPFHQPMHHSHHHGHHGHGHQHRNTHHHHHHHHHPHHSRPSGGGHSAAEFITMNEGAEPSSMMPSFIFDKMFGSGANSLSRRETQNSQHRAPSSSSSSSSSSGPNDIIITSGQLGPQFLPSPLAQLFGLGQQQQSMGVGENSEVSLMSPVSVSIGGGSVGGSGRQLSAAADSSPLFESILNQLTGGGGLNLEDSFSSGKQQLSAANKSSKQRHISMLAALPTARASITVTSTIRATPSSAVDDQINNNVTAASFKKLSVNQQSNQTVTPVPEATAGNNKSAPETASSEGIPAHLINFTSITAHPDMAPPMNQQAGAMMMVMPQGGPLNPMLKFAASSIMSRLMQAAATAQSADNQQPNANYHKKARQHRHNLIDLDGDNYLELGGALRGAASIVNLDNQSEPSPATSEQQQQTSNKADHNNNDKLSDSIKSMLQQDIGNMLPPGLMQMLVSSSPFSASPSAQQAASSSDVRIYGPPPQGRTLPNGQQVFSMERIIEMPLPVSRMDPDTDQELDGSTFIFGRPTRAELLVASDNNKNNNSSKSTSLGDILPQAFRQMIAHSAQPHVQVASRPAINQYFNQRSRSSLFSDMMQPPSPIMVVMQIPSSSNASADNTLNIDPSSSSDDTQSLDEGIRRILMALHRNTNNNGSSHHHHHHINRAHYHQRHQQPIHKSTTTTTTTTASAAGTNQNNHGLVSLSSATTNANPVLLPPVLSAAVAEPQSMAFVMPLGHSTSGSQASKSRHSTMDQVDGASGPDIAPSADVLSYSHIAPPMFASPHPSAYYGSPLAGPMPYGPPPPNPFFAPFGMHPMALMSPVPLGPPMGPPMSSPMSSSYSRPMMSGGQDGSHQPGELMGASADQLAASGAFKWPQNLATKSMIVKHSQQQSEQQQATNNNNVNTNQSVTSVINPTSIDANSQNINNKIASLMTSEANTNTASHVDPIPWNSNNNKMMKEDSSRQQQQVAPSPFGANKQIVSPLSIARSMIMANSDNDFAVDKINVKYSNGGNNDNKFNLNQNYDIRNQLFGAPRYVRQHRQQRQYEHQFYPELAPSVSPTNQEIQSSMQSRFASDNQPMPSPFNNLEASGNNQKMMILYADDQEAKNNNNNDSLQPADRFDSIMDPTQAVESNDSVAFAPGHHDFTSHNQQNHNHEIRYSAPISERIALGMSAASERRRLMLLRNDKSKTL